MSRLLVMSSSPLVSVMVWMPFANSIVAPLGAAAIVSRNEPGPLSALLVTIRGLSTVRSSRTSSLGTEDRRWGGGRRKPGRLWERWELQVRSGSREVSLMCVSPARLWVVSHSH